MAEHADDDPVARARTLAEDDPYCAHLGIELVDIGSGTATTELTITEDLLNFHGTPHGGAVYSVADAAFAAASNSHGDAAFALETNISYLAPVEVGETLTATATETHAGGRTAEYQIPVTGPDDERIATFRGRVYKPG
ncbi:hydroxyphenylacetyl-CoA thioesterase PaaI [Natronobeatus ordinarius]|uniref:hydroxyphenylacetyl-CoA thioesterase PaaI n=1 Tax=Natronobeatus ordinarius TaxID=2963433 RepID=UPI0020CB8DA7|nr:hydroxyphenylacetyl-CoA thioesterase PaaI [Natronobeatus ordinarius]